MKNEKIVKLLQAFTPWDAQEAADVESELQAYKDSLSANDLYAEFADKVALAKDARIVTNGDYVAIVIAGISNPDYSAIDTALETALNF